MIFFFPFFFIKFWIFDISVYICIYIKGVFMYMSKGYHFSTKKKQKLSKRIPWMGEDVGVSHRRGLYVRAPFRGQHSWVKGPHKKNFKRPKSKWWATSDASDENWEPSMGLCGACWTVQRVESYLHDWGSTLFCTCLFYNLFWFFIISENKIQLNIK